MDHAEEEAKKLSPLRGYTFKKFGYSYDEMEAFLSEKGFLIYEHKNAAEATEAFFREYNQKNAEHVMTAPEGVGYCLAVKK